jgi:hypothetical protein
MRLKSTGVDAREAGRNYGTWCVRSNFWRHFPQLKSADVRNILSASAKNIGPVKTDIGAGLVDPLQALTKAGPKSAEMR